MYFHSHPKLLTLKSGPHKIGLDMTVFSEKQSIGSILDIYKTTPMKIAEFNLWVC